ncbi:unnamed protein product [Acanthoscelides obtectus]|uniref:Uncharacterized protein n=1 Tax=Acanthoscelides obtectus TaxID=200917 RepID=A0A9P0MDW1_ACAOB|nr:unnamed protein product [Acanthoscelides obtectus]CAK1626277.1 hypothetical protein AOBTE_LOCUS3743 [Acanthoscelides obtectus]
MIERTYANNNVALSGKVDSSSCIEKWIYCCLREFFNASLCKTVFRTPSTAGKINFSPIVCGFPDFAISNKIL